MAVAFVLIGLGLGARAVAQDCVFIRGNVTNETGVNAIDLNDAVDILAYLFLGTIGSKPECLDAADVNDNGFVEMGDYLYLVRFLFHEGPPPPAPFPDAGADPTPGSGVADTRDDRFTFKIGSAVGFPSHTGLEIPITLSNQVGIEGLQLVLEYDGALVRVDEFRLEETALAEFSDRSYIIYQFFNNAGRSFAGVSALLNWDPPLSGQTIAPGEDQLLARMVVGITLTAEPQETLITFADSAIFPGPVSDDERPEVHNFVFVDNQVIRPQLEGAPGGGVIDIRTAFIRGDSNVDRRVDISDSVYLLQYLFYGGPAPQCDDSADINNDSRIDLSDSIFILNYLFKGGPQPPAPYPAPGLDPEVNNPEVDALDC